MKKKNMEKPYDGKKSAWVPDKSTGGYLEGLCENDMKVADWEAIGKKVNVIINGEASTFFLLSNVIFVICPPSPGETKTYKSDAICQVGADKPLSCIGRLSKHYSANIKKDICMISTED